MSEVDFHSEEDVKVKFLLPLLESLGYNIKHCEFETPIEVQEGRRTKTIFADVIVYGSAKKPAPLMCVETKAPNVPLTRADRDQAISYARLLPKIAPIAVLTNGRQVQVFRTFDKTRVPAIPPRSAFDSGMVEMVLNKAVSDALRAEAKHELFIIDDVQTFKRLLKASHDEIRNNEGYDPTQAFDELSKVLFCKMYEEKNGDSNRFRVSVFDETLKTVSVNVVQAIFKETITDPRYKGLFDANDSIRLQDRTLRKIVELFERTDLSLTAFDVKGEAFEYFLGDTFTGGLGQYFTPRNVVSFIVDALNLKIGERIVDPFCGTGGFLIHAFEVVSEKIRLQDFSDAEKEQWRETLSNRSLFGIDWSARTSQTCKMNMVVHGDGSAGIFKSHGLLDVPGVIETSTFDLCLTNPPFGSWENDEAILGAYELGAGRTTQDRAILAVERAIELVKVGGRIGIVIIDGVLNNRSYKYVRDYIRANTRIHAVVSLSPETFEAYGGRSDTSILLLERIERREGPTHPEPIFMARATNTGYAPNGSAIAGNQLPDILLSYEGSREKEFEGGPFGRMVSTSDRLDPSYYLLGTASDVASAADALSLARTTVESILANVTELENESQRVGESVRYVDMLLADVIAERKVRVTVNPEMLYPLLGVRWWGDGTFVKEAKRGSEIRAKNLFVVSSGSFIYNRLFAFRGSFAIVPPEQDGCFVSGEFPTLVAKEAQGEAGLLLLRYLAYLMNTPHMLAVVDALSTGSTRTSRNRFSVDDLLSLSVPVPASIEDVALLVGIMDRVVESRAEAMAALEQMKDVYRSLGGFLFDRPPTVGPDLRLSIDADPEDALRALLATRPQQ